MSTEGVHRKLAAILCADVEGYSRLMQDDPEGTLHTLTGHREIFRRCTEYHDGRVVDSPGDNILIEFASAIEAVQCAVEIQRELAEKNAALSADRRMQFRIGIDLGDLLEKDDALYGDGVNISARLQSLAESGGICISGRAYDQVVNRLPLKFEFLGNRSVKNIAQTIRVYRVLTQPGDAVHDVVRPKPWVSSHWSKIAMTIAVMLITIAGAGLVWQHYVRGPKTAPVATEKMPSPLPSPPSIAVLPFDDLSPERDQEYFVLGLSGEILNSLAQIKGLTVIAKTSSFSFRGTSKTIQEIADVLGVENILEGSVRKAGNAMRITAQLIKAVDGAHLWSKTYDKEFKVEELFSVQEDIAKEVADELKATFGIEVVLENAGGTENEEAYAYYLAASGQDSFNLSLEFLDAAIAQDPEFALAWAGKALLHLTIAAVGPGSADQASLEQDMALSSVMRAIEIEPSLAEAHSMLGLYQTIKGDFISAESSFHKALELKTDLSSVVPGIISHYMAVGCFDNVKEMLEEALRNDPLNSAYRLWHIIYLSHLGETRQIEEEFIQCEILFGDSWKQAVTSYHMMVLRLGGNAPPALDDLPFSDQITEAVRNHIGSPEEGLAELRRIYADEDNLSIMNLMGISVGAAYFNDPEFALSILERAIGYDAIATLWVWYPIFHEVRQLPRFKEFVREIGLVDYWEQFDWPDICHPTGDGDFVCD